MIGHPRKRLHWLLAAAVLALSIGSIATARAEDVVRIGLPTKTYYPTIIAETAQRQGLFAKEGIKAELTIYRSGAETFEAMAAGAADLQLNSVALVAAGRPKGVKVKAVAGAALGYYGWYFMVKADSKAAKISDFEGKKIGITAAGSASDVLARWTMQDRKVKFTTVPLGGGGLVPNMLSGNVDAVVLYSPLSFRVLQEKQGRSLIDYGASVPPHLSGVWIAPDKLIGEKPQLIQKTLNALYGAVAFLQDKANRAESAKLVAEIDEIPPKIAEAELDDDLSHMSATGEMTEEWLNRSLDLARLVGMNDLAPMNEIYTAFKPVPTKK
jgi:NitT/TauT family transport system substrate-binding protein